MAFDDNLLLAILAMDSYNRGLNASVKISTSATGLGTATLRSDGEVPSAWTQVSFFASSYDWDRKTVISYRGTDAADRSEKCGRRRCSARALPVPRPAMVVAKRAIGECLP